VEVDAFDLSGRRITRVFKGWMEPGSRALSWDGRGDRGQEIPNGVYFLRAASGGLAVSQRIVLLKSP
jgi:hypothetical protein